MADLRPLVLLSALAGCAPDPGGAPKDTGPTASDTEPTETDPTTTPAPQWPHGQPELSIQQIVQGDLTQGRIDGLPPGTFEVALHVGSGLADGTCAFGACVALEDGALWSTFQIDGEDPGFTLEIPDDTPTGEWFVQAVVTDPAYAASTWTNAVERPVMVPPGRARASFEDASATALGAPIFTFGNSHTGGTCWLDYNKDWWPDLFITNGAGTPHRLLRNDGDGRFTDVSELVPTGGADLEEAGCAFGDLDRDGDVDLVIAVDSPVPVDTFLPQPYEGGPNLVYRNDGLAGFTEVAATTGLVDPRGWRNSTVSLVDVDRDGRLDVFFGNWAPANPEPDNDDRLLRNLGGLKFEDVTAEYGVDGHGRDTLTATWVDLDFDGHEDGLVGAIAYKWNPPGDDPRATIYRSRADGTFYDGTDPGVGDDSWAAMAADVGDVDNDGDWDAYVTDLWAIADSLPRGNPLYLGEPDGSLGDNRCDVAGVCTGSATWPASFADFDRDGWVDLYVGTSFESDPELLFLNDGDGTFTANAVLAFTHNNAHGGSTADYDGDGAVDLFDWNYAQNSRLYRNAARDDNHWLSLALQGVQSNPDAVGATVRVTAGGITQLRRISAGDSAHSQRERVVHVGLGAATSANVEITWPNGLVESLPEVAADQLAFVVEGKGLRPETVSVTATCAAGELTVVAVSSAGGRTALSVDGFGDLAWDPAGTAFAATFDVSDTPAFVVVNSTRGGSWKVPVAH